MPRRRNRSVFISYRRADSQAWAARLADSLEKQGWDAFRDIDDLQPGVPFASALGQTISRCHAAVIVIGPKWLEELGRRGGDREDYVRLEVEAALASDSVLVVPVLVAGASMPAKEDLPEGLEELAERNAIPLRDDAWTFDVGRLVGVLGPGARVPRWAIVAGVVIAGGAGLLAWSQRDPTPPAETVGLQVLPEAGFVSRLAAPDVEEPARRYDLVLEQGARSDTLPDVRFESVLIAPDTARLSAASSEGGLTRLEEALDIALDAIDPAQRGAWKERLRRRRVWTPIPLGPGELSVRLLDPSGIRIADTTLDVEPNSPPRLDLLILRMKR